MSRAKGFGSKHGFDRAAEVQRKLTCGKQSSTVERRLYLFFVHVAGTRVV